jgi:hypothetical protein
MSAAFMVLPDIPGLASFAEVARRKGWQVIPFEGVDRDSAIRVIADLVNDETIEGTPVVISGDTRLMTQLGPASIEYVDDLSLLPDLT